MLINEADFKAALPISTGFEFSKILPDIRRAELKWIKPILGVDLYSILDGNYVGETTTADEDALLEFIHPALAHLAMALYTPKGNVYVNDNGLQAIHSGDSKPAFQHQVDDFEESMRENGFDGLDELIEYLESVANTDFPDWLASEGCTLVRSNFVNTAKDFTAYVPKLRGSRYLFVQVKPIMDRVERELIRSIVGKDLFAELKEEVADDNLSAANLALMDYIKPAVTHAAWANALYELALEINKDGVHMLNNTFSGTTKAKQPGNVDTIRVVKDHHMSVALGSQKDLQEYLVENVDDYPLFKDGETYDSEDPDPQFENDDDHGFVVL